MARNSDLNSRRIVFWQTFWILCRVAIFLFGLTILAALFSDRWIEILGDIPGEIKHEAIIAVEATTILYLLRLPTVAFTSAFIGFQEVHWERFYVVLLPVIFTFVALLATIYLSGDLIVLACLSGGAPLLAGIMAGVHFILSHRNVMHRPQRSNSDEALIKDFLLSSKRFFIMGITGMVVWNTDNLVISYIRGPESVTAYAITFKLFATAFSIFILANSVLMPMFGNAFGKKEWAWLSQIYDGGLSLLTTFSGLVWIGGIVFAKPIILLWTGMSGYGGGLVVFALGGYGYLLSVINLQAIFLSSMNATRSLLWVGIAEAITNLGLSLLFIRWWGIGGVALGTFTAALSTSYWLLPKVIVTQSEQQVEMPWPTIMKHLGLAVTPAILAAFLISEVFYGASLWMAGISLCVLYLAISWMLLPQQAKVLLKRVLASEKHESKGGRFSN